MKKMIYPVAALLIIAASAFTIYQAQGWKIGENYSVKFTSADPSGVFTGLKGTINFDEKNLAASKFDVSIDVASINTGNGTQNGHAKTATGYEAKGTLEMHGVQKEAVIPFTFADNTFTGSFDVNREDFNLNPSNGRAGKVIKVELVVPVTKA